MTAIQWDFDYGDVELAESRYAPEMLEHADKLGASLRQVEDRHVRPFGEAPGPHASEREWMEFLRELRREGDPDFDLWQERYEDLFDADPDFEDKHPRGDEGKFRDKPGSLTDPSLRQFVDMVANLQGNLPASAPGKLLQTFGREYSFDETSYTGKRGKQHQCYTNAGRLALGNDDLTYVEGYVSVHGVPIEHAWTVDKDGHVVDPTIKGGQQIKGYFGVPINTQFLRRFIVETGVWGVFGAQSLEKLLQYRPEQIVTAERVQRGPRQNPASEVDDALRPRTLYVRRDVLNGEDIVEWAKSVGFPTTVSPDEMHVTLCYSKQPLNWMAVPENNIEGAVATQEGSNKRVLEEFGDGATVLVINSDYLQFRHEEIKRAGATSDYPEYHPHITITYQKPDGLDITKLQPYRGKIVLGPEVWEEIEPNHKDRMEAEDTHRPFDAGRRSQLVVGDDFEFDFVFDASRFEESEHPRGHFSNKGRFRAKGVSEKSGRKRVSALVAAKFVSGSEGYDDGNLWENEGRSADAINRLFVDSSSGVTDSELKALYKYVDSGIFINDALRQRAELTGRQKSTIKALDQLFKDKVTLSTDLTGYRGADDSVFSMLESLGVGGEFVDAGYVSTSLRSRIAAVYGGVRIALLLPKGSKALPIAQRKDVPYNTVEVLVNRGSRFKVTRLDKKNKTAHLTLLED